MQVLNKKDNKSQRQSLKKSTVDTEDTAGISPNESIISSAAKEYVRDSIDGAVANITESNMGAKSKNIAETVLI